MAKTNHYNGLNPVAVLASDTNDLNDMSHVIISFRRVND